MLYVTTRNQQEACTVQHALKENVGLDGGMYLPFRFPALSSADLSGLAEMSFNQRIAEILNMFFSRNLSGWDIDFSIGRYPCRYEQLPNKIVMAEVWHNPKWQYRYIENRLMELLGASVENPGNWVSIAVRMAVLAAVLMDVYEKSDSVVDISTVCGDFSVPITAIYLQKMGFPIGNIICCCDDNSHIWNLLCLGQMKTNTEIPVHLERLITDRAGTEETKGFIRCCTEGDSYTVTDTMLQELQRGIHVSVVSNIRTETTVPNVYKTYRYILHSDSANAYSGIMDYRAKTGIFRPAVVICDRSPVFEADMIKEYLDLTKEELFQIL